jgi:hypothetical protein
MDAGRKSFLPAGVFYIFVSATKAIQILRKIHHPNPAESHPNLKNPNKSNIFKNQDPKPKKN